MDARIWPGTTGSTAGPAPSRQRAEGRVRLVAARFGKATGVAALSEQGSARLRLPRARGSALDAVLINTGGGITGGDVFDTAIAAEAGAELAVSTVAAEKIYRSDGSTAAVGVHLRVAPGARLDWIPQETIVFDRARARRRLDAEIQAGGTLLVFEALVFGRAARGETVETGSLEDRWRIRREGRLVYADTLRLDGAVSALLARPAIAAGSRVLATLLLVAEDAEARLEDMRGILAAAGIEGGAGAWNGMLAMRMLSPEIDALRICAARAITALRGRPMPRVWLT